MTQFAFGVLRSLRHAPFQPNCKISHEISTFTRLIPAKEKVLALLNNTYSFTLIHSIMSRPITGYWNFRGYMQPIQLLLAYTGTDYEDKRYNWNRLTYDRSDWLNVKHTFGFDFPNVPYYIDGDVKLTQTVAILKYLGRKHGLVPKSEDEQIRVDLIEAEALDMRWKWSRLGYNPEFENVKPQYLKDLEVKLKEISTFLGSHPYFAGQTMTYVDFFMYELLDINLSLCPTALDEFSNLREFHARIGGLEKLAAYLKSDKCVKYPFFAPHAAWGGK